VTELGCLQILISTLFASFFFITYPSPALVLIGLPGNKSLMLGKISSRFLIKMSFLI